MTKSRGIGRGGCRFGPNYEAAKRAAAAGHEPAPTSPRVVKPSVALVEVIPAAEAQVAIIQASKAGKASDMMRTAFETLQAVMVGAQYAGTAKVSAAKTIIELARAEQASANGATGKKAERIEAAMTLSTEPTDDWGADLMQPGAAN